MDQLYVAKQVNRALQLMVQALNLPDTNAMEIADLYEEYAIGKTYQYTCYAGDAKPVFDRKYCTLLEEKPDWLRQGQLHLYPTEALKATIQPSLSRMKTAYSLKGQDLTRDTRAKSWLTGLTHIHI